MAHQHAPDEASGATLALFLVELRGAAGAATEVNGMHDALAFAVSRLRLTGVPIRCDRTLMLPGEPRCLCLVEAGDRQAVHLALDTAGLGAAQVHEAYPLPDTATGGVP